MDSRSDSDVEDESSDGLNVPSVEPRTATAATKKATAFSRGSESDASVKQDEEDESEGWGASNQDYYNADPIETEADALEEEAEALRLQKKALEKLTEADYGFGETEWLDSGKGDVLDEDSDAEGIVREVLPQAGITDSMGPEERSKLLATRYPEFGPLAKEFIQLQELHHELSVATSTDVSMRSQKAITSGFAGIFLEETSVVSIKLSALTAYLASLTMYFAILTSSPQDEMGKTMAKSPLELRQHPIMDSLVQCRNLWEKVKDIPIPAASLHDVRDAHIVATKDEDARGANTITHDANNRQDAEKRKKKRKSKAQRAVKSAMAEAQEQRAERLRRLEEDLAKLPNISARKVQPSGDITETRLAVGDGDDSDLGEETFLTAAEAAEKAKRRKSLRFYTSQIVQKSNKRENAGRDAGGDEDIPHRERLKDRQARLNAEAEARGKKGRNANIEPLGGESDDEDRKVAKELRKENENSEDEYYDLVASRSRKKKADKQALATAHKQAALEGGTVIEQEIIGKDGKRAISYAIEKNKGLTPKRNKDVRNPRVKKRKKYEDKKKKLGSIKPLYKGGEGRGGYGGELTGIKSGLIRSVKL